MPRIHTSVLSVITVLAMPGVANAVVCQTPNQGIYESDRVIKAVDKRIEKLEYAIVAALKLHAGQMTGNIEKSTLTITQALDGQTQLQAQIAREEAEVEAFLKHDPSEAVCVGITGMAGMSATEEITQEIKKKGSRREIARMTADKVGKAKPGQNHDTNGRYMEVLSTYCNDSRTFSENSACKGKTALHNADLDPISIYGRPTLEKLQDRKTAADFIRNVATPTIDDPIALAKDASVPERKEILRHRSGIARTALANEYLTYAYAKRAPAVELGPWAKAVVTDPDAIPDTAISKQQLLQIFARDRFLDPSFFVNLNSVSDTNLLREQIMQGATLSMLMWELLEITERQGSMIAAMLAMKTEEQKPGSKEEKNEARVVNQ